MIDYIDKWCMAVQKSDLPPGTKRVLMDLAELARKGAVPISALTYPKKPTGTRRAELRSGVARSRGRRLP